jgi:HAD superfamily hydrolase (TIGR01459 family)
LTAGTAARYAAAFMPIPLHRRLSEFVGPYEAVLSDLWGCVHDGVAPYPGAVDALRRLRRSGRRVVLISNAPRPWQAVAEQLQRMGVAADCWDAIVTSGDATVEGFNAAFAGRRYWPLGPERDAPLFRLLDGEPAPADVAEVIVATGLFDDETEKSEDYREKFESHVKAGRALVCANPDVVVNRGPRLLECAGALAQLYESLGGRVHLYGKPHEPIYRLAMARLGDPPKSRVLAIGDGLPTDVAGAQTFGLDSAWIAGGIHAADLGPAPDPEAVARVAAAAGRQPTFAVPALVW